jgi:hypothetical protein
MPQERRTNLALALIGLATGGLYALLALRYPLIPSLARPRASWVDLTSPGWVSPLYHLAIYLGLTILYILALHILTRTRLAAGPAGTRLWIIAAAWLAGSAILLPIAPAGESHDVFDYIFRGRMMAELGANPLTDVPDSYNTAPYYAYVAWRSNVDTYGPAWETTSAGVAVATRAGLRALGWWDAPGPSCPQSPSACRELAGYITAYRLLAVGLTGASAVLIGSMVRRNRPRLVAAALLAWLWSPLLLLSTAAGAHNDALMLTLLLLALWLVQRRRWLPALLVLVVAAHVKIAALLVAPVVGLWLVRRLGWRRAAALAAAALAAGLLFSAAVYAPFGGWATLPRMLKERVAFLSNSPWRVLYEFLLNKPGATEEAARRLSTRMATALFVAVALPALLWMLDFRPRRWKSMPAPDWSDDRLLWRAVAAVTLIYLLAGSFWFQHWYIAWALAPAALLPDSLLARQVLPWLGFGALSANVISAFGPAAAGMPLPQITLSALMVGVIWLPALIAAVWHLGWLRAQTQPRIER